MKRVLWFAASAVVAACASQAPLRGANESGKPVVDVGKAADSIRGSTKAAVSAALGPASVVRFDSGYEVWVYRFVAVAAGEPSDKRVPRAEDRPPSELVLLFSPSGVVYKVRVRSTLISERGSED